MDTSFKCNCSWNFLNWRYPMNRLLLWSMSNRGIEIIHCNTSFYQCYRYSLHYLSVSCFRKMVNIFFKSWNISGVSVTSWDISLLTHLPASIYVFKVNNRNFKKTLWPLFYVWGSTASRLEPLLGVSLPFTTKSPEIRTMCEICSKWTIKTP